MLPGTNRLLQGGEWRPGSEHDRWENVRHHRGGGLLPEGLHGREERRKQTDQWLGRRKAFPVTEPKPYH